MDPVQAGAALDQALSDFGAFRVGFDADVKTDSQAQAALVAAQAQASQSHSKVAQDYTDAHTKLESIKAAVQAYEDALAAAATPPAPNPPSPPAPPAQ